MIEDYPHLERERVFRVPAVPFTPVEDTLYDSLPDSVVTSFDHDQRRKCTSCGHRYRDMDWASLHGHCLGCGGQVEFEAIGE